MGAYEVWYEEKTRYAYIVINSFKLKTIGVHRIGIETLKLWLNESERIWVLVANSNILIPTSVQPDGINLWYFKLRLFDLIEIDLNISGLRHWVAKI